MTASKRKGSAFERDVVDFLRGRGFPFAERRQAGAQYDLGDITGIPGFTFECKARQALDVAGAVDEAVVEAANAARRFGVETHPVAVMKRRGKNVAQAYAVMRLEDFTALMREAGYGHSPAEVPPP